MKASPTCSPVGFGTAIACSKAEDREILCTDIKPAEDALLGLVKKR
ncbi:hypothetical protein [[Kitasatospora] papulosa]